MKLLVFSSTAMLALAQYGGGRRGPQYPQAGYGGQASHVGNDHGANPHAGHDHGANPHTTARGGMASSSRASGLGGLGGLSSLGSLGGLRGTNARSQYAVMDPHAGHDHGANPHTTMATTYASRDPHAGHDHDANPHTVPEYYADPHAGHDHDANPHRPTGLAAMGGLASLSGLNLGQLPRQPAYVDPHAGHDHDANPHTEVAEVAEEETPAPVVDDKALVEETPAPVVDDKALVEVAKEEELVEEAAVEEVEEEVEEEAEEEVEEEEHDTMAYIEALMASEEGILSAEMKAKFVSGELKRGTAEFAQWKQMLKTKCPWYRQQLRKAASRKNVVFPFFGMLKSGRGPAWSGDYSTPTTNWNATLAHAGTASGNRLHDKITNASP